MPKGLPWITVLSGVVSVDTLLGEITGRELHLTEQAHRMMCHPSFLVPPKAEFTDLVLVDPADFGLVGNNWSPSALISLGEKRGIGRCQPIIAPHVFLQISERDLAETRLIFVMDVLSGPDLDPQIFTIEHRPRSPMKLWLSSIKPDADILPTDRLVFSQLRQP